MKCNVFCGIINIWKARIFMQDYINMLSSNLRYISKEENDKGIKFLVESTVNSPICPYCGIPCSFGLLKSKAIRLELSRHFN